MRYGKYAKKTHPELLESDHSFDTGVVPGREVMEAAAAAPLSCSGDVFAQLFGLKAGDSIDPNMAVSGRVLWAAVQWVRSGRPIMRLTDELRDMLLATEPPDEPLEGLPDIPFDGFYLTVSGGFEMWDNTSGFHQAEGLYVCRDRMMARAEDGEAAPREGLMVIGVGENKAGKKQEGLLRNDTLQYFAVIPGMRLDFWKSAIPGMKELLQIVVNLLLLWNSEGSIITMKGVRPELPKSPSKRKKLERRGYSAVKYMTLGVREGYLDHQKTKTDISGWDGPVHVAMVRGFFRKYWVMDPTTAQVLGESTNDKGTKLYCIRRFVAPHRALRRGEAPEKNIYQLKES